MSLAITNTKNTKQVSRKPVNESAAHYPQAIPNSSPHVSTSMNQKMVCACGGACPRCQINANTIQPKLKVGAPDDKYEQEADRVADQVMRMPEPRVQRQVETNQADEVEQDEEDEEVIEKEATPVFLKRREGAVQRQSQQDEDEEQQAIPQDSSEHGHDATVSAETGQEIQSLKGGGQSLPVSTRQFFEPRIGTDFSKVRIHNDARADRAARSMNARAFTLGNDVVFSAGEYSPGTQEGKRLLAHELTHVIQQTMPSRIKSVNSGGAISRSPRSIQRVINLTTCKSRGLDFKRCYKIDSNYKDAIQYTAKAIQALKARRYTPTVQRAMKLYFNITGMEHKQAIIDKLKLMLETMKHYKTNMLYARGHDSICNKKEKDKERVAYATKAKMKRGKIVQESPGVWFCPPFFSSGMGSAARTRTIIHEHAHAAGIGMSSGVGGKELYVGMGNWFILKPTRLLRCADSFAYLVMAIGGSTPVLASVGAEVGVGGGVYRPPVAGVRKSPRIGWLVRGYIDVTHRKAILRVLYLYGQAAFTVLMTLPVYQKPGEQKALDSALLLELIGGLRIKLRKKTLGANWYLSMGGGPLLVISDVRDEEGRVKRVSYGFKAGLSSTVRIKQLEFKAGLSYLNLPKVPGFEHSLFGGLTVGYRFTWP